MRKQRKQDHPDSGQKPIDLRELMEGIGHPVETDQRVNESR